MKQTKLNKSLFKQTLTLTEALLKAHNKTFTVVFTKSDNTERTMLAKKGLKRFLSKKPNKRSVTLNSDIVRVYDMESKSYKSFKLSTVKEVRFGSVIWSAE